MVLLVAHLNAQQDVPIGKWKAHLPFNHGLDVTIGNDNIYYASDFGILKLPAENHNDLQYITRVDGLSDAEPKLVRYHDGLDILIVVYNNANIDLIYENGIVNLSDIMTSNVIFGERQINQISFDQNNKVYFSCNFGLVQLNLEDNTFGFTIITNSSVNDFNVWNTNFYMSTETGLYKAPVANFNHQDFTRWELMGEDYGLPSGPYQSVGNTVYEDRFYVAIEDDVFTSEGDDFFPLLSESSYSPRFLTTTGDYLVVGWNCESGCSRGKAMLIGPSGEITEVVENCINRVNNVVVNSNGKIFVADDFRGIRFANSKSENCNQIATNTPYSQNVTDMDVKDNVLYVASGGVTDNFNYRFRRDGYFVYKDGKWSSNNLFNTPEFADPEMYDFYQIKAHPTQEKLFVGTFWRGLIEIENEEITIYDRHNSCLEFFVPENLRERISGMAFDPLNRLWLTNDGAPNPIKMFDNEGNCHSYSFPNLKFLTDIDIDFNGYKWMAVRNQGAGIAVFHEGSTGDPSDERTAVLNNSNSNLPTNDVLSLKTDLNGSVWVGTSDGVVVFDCTSLVFEGNCSGTRRRVEQDGFIAELLAGERVQAIAVDGANRKWFGTTNGLFLQSASGDEQIAAFNKSNSPLIDNNITSIAINDQTGEVYIGTSKGIMSYRSDATKGESTHSSNVTVFPNPVRPDYEGPIAIRGLARDARVKITDVRGNLVFETVANGGQAIWYGRDLEGRKANSGVYIVLASTAPTDLTSPEGETARIMLVR